MLIGVTGQGGLFTESIVRDMAARCRRPIIMPMSNPTSRAEARPDDLIRWTDGRALVATGSPFEPVSHNGRTITISQANNVYVFPGLGLGAIISRATKVTDAMFVAAAEAIGHRTGTATDADAGLLPPIEDVANVSRRVAAGVARVACDEGVGRPLSDDEIETRIADYWWTPDYPSLTPLQAGSGSD